MGENTIKNTRGTNSERLALQHCCSAVPETSHFQVQRCTNSQLIVREDVRGDGDIAMWRGDDEESIWELRAEPPEPLNDMRGEDPRGDTPERGEVLGENKRGETTPKLRLPAIDDLLACGEHTWSHLVTSFSIDRARDAYLSVLKDSSALKLVGDIFTNIKVFAVPPKLSCMSIVSLWLRYGITFVPAVMALMTSHNAVSDLVISIASLCISPVTCVFEIRSLPARSTIVIFPVLVRPVTLSVIDNLIVKKRCDLDESAFKIVEATFLWPKP